MKEMAQGRALPSPPHTSPTQPLLRELAVLTYALERLVRNQTTLAAQGHDPAPAQWSDWRQRPLRLRTDAPPVVERPVVVEGPSMLGPSPDPAPSVEPPPEGPSMLGPSPDPVVVEGPSMLGPSPQEDEPQPETPRGRPRYPWEEDRRKGPAHAVGRVDEGVSGLEMFRKIVQESALTPKRKVFERLGETPSLAAIRDAMGECTRCGLCRGRRSIVFGGGSETADVMIIGSTPGALDDERGEPFLGPAGGLLEKILNAMGLAREQVYMTHVVKCRPVEERPAERNELAACHPFLMRQIKVVQPSAIVSLGPAATRGLLGSRAPFEELRGVWQRLRGEPLVMPTLHPAFLLKHEGAKRIVWGDMQKVMERLREHKAL